MKYQRLTRDDRYQIMALYESKLSARKIAAQLGKDPSTISREIKRNRAKNRYLASYAQNLYKQRRSGVHPPKRTIGQFAKEIDRYLSEHWSPEQISGRLKLRGITVAHETIYQYIYSSDQKAKFTYKNLRSGQSRRWTHRGRRNLRKSRKGHNFGQKMFSERPKIVDQRIRLGDFERDTMRGSTGNARLLTIVDRVSKVVRIAKVEGLRPDYTHNATIKLLARVKVHTITNDNGQEFSTHKRTAKKLKTAIYFNDPYSSWQRGTNENTNGLIRQYFPKGTNFDEITSSQIKKAVHRLNNRPRKTLGYRTPLEVDHELSQVVH